MNERPEYKDLNTKLLCVDKLYQREVDMARVRKMNTQFRLPIKICFHCTGPTDGIPQYARFHCHFHCQNNVILGHYFVILGHYFVKNGKSKIEDSKINLPKK